MASKDLKLSDLTDSLTKLQAAIKNHAGIIFVIIILGAVVYSVSAVNVVLNTPSDADYRIRKQAEVTGTQFNTKTIEKIEALGMRDSTPAPQLPAGRINPFVE